MWVGSLLVMTVNKWENDITLCLRPLWHFLCAASSKPIRRQWKASHWRWWPLPHSVIAELEAWWIVVQDNVLLLDWMLCFDLNRCPWSLNNGWYVNNQSGYLSSILHLLPCQSELQGEGDGGRDGVRGDKSLSSLPPYGSPVRVTLGVVACLLSYPQSTRQWHADSGAWHQVFSQRQANPLFSKMEETQLHQAHSL